MRKRKLRLDRELLTTVTPPSIDAGISLVIIVTLTFETIGGGGGSGAEPTCTGCTCVASCPGANCQTMYPPC
jgi:hypothetical protein